jgi:hypothetical protein
MKGTNNGEALSSLEGLLGLVRFQSRRVLGHWWAVSPILLIGRSELCVRGG